MWFLEKFKAMLEEFRNEPVKSGDLIQWECNGAYCFPEPRKVSYTHSCDDLGTYVFVEGSNTGIPASEVIIVKRS